MMFISEQNKIDPEAVEEFQWQGLEPRDLVSPSEPQEFQLWDYSLPEGSCPEGPGLGVEGKVEDILAAAHLKAQDIEQQAYEEGFQQGQKDGHEVGRRALEEVVKRLQSLVTSLEQDRDSLFRQREGVILDLVVLISEKLVARELSLYPEAIRQIIEEGFRQVGHQEGLRLLVSPLDHEVLQQENLDSWPRGVELQTDGTISPGGFRLETSLGEVDGTRETRWSLIVQAVQQAVETVNAATTD
jgi:flagellar assembly protein FliH